MAAIQTGVQAGTGMELEHVVWFIQEPDAGERRTQIFHHRLRAAPQHVR